MKFRSERMDKPVVRKPGGATVPSEPDSIYKNIKLPWRDKSKDGSTSAGIRAAKGGFGVFFAVNF